MDSDFFKQTPPKLICIRIDCARAFGAGEAKTLRNLRMWCLLDDVKTFFEQNPDAD